MTVLQAIRWGVNAWELDINPITIQHCWLKLQVLGPKYGPQSEEEAQAEGWVEPDLTVVINQLEKQIQALANQNRIKSAMSIATFLNPPMEDLVPTETLDLNDIAEAYCQGDREYETEEEDVLIPLVTEKEALQALEHLRLYEETARRR